MLPSWPQKKFLENTDHAMAKRGWSRLVGVINENDVVLIYVLTDMTDGDPIEVCLAVVNDEELVVASTQVDGLMLSEWLKQHTGRDSIGRSLPTLESFRSLGT